jgi:chorismate mutase
MAVRAVRGAIQIDKNEASLIKNGVIQLINNLININEIVIENIISIIFTQTSDLDVMNPASALRTEGFSDTALFCAKEPDIVGSMKRVIRVLITVESDNILTCISCWCKKA